MGGTLTPSRTPGGGLTMTVTLGVWPMPRLLIVEDEPALRRALTINLAARHYEVEATGTGAAALRAAAANPPDLVIVDLGSARSGRS